MPDLCLKCGTVLTVYKGDTVCPSCRIVMNDDKIEDKQVENSLLKKRIQTPKKCPHKWESISKEECESGLSYLFEWCNKCGTIKKTSYFYKGPGLTDYNVEIKWIKCPKILTKRSK